MENETQTAVIWTGIFSDANYFGRYFRDVARHADDPLNSALAFCMAPYFSLTMHESLQKARKIDPDISAVFKEGTIAISARSRHSLKLFEDTKRGIEGQISYFREVFTAHSAKFLGNTWLPLARFLETDLGLSSYDGRLVSTTHAATFHLGFEPNELLAEGSGDKIRAVFEEYGSYFAGLGASLDDQGAETFVTSLSPSILDEPRDVRASKYYRKVFNGPETPELNAILTTFRAMLNFAEIVVSSGVDRQHLDYTAFKIGYLSLYQVLRSVRILLDDSSYRLTVRSAAIADRIVNLESARDMLNPAAKPFRNMLMHYNLPPKIDIAKVDLSQPFFGTIPIYFPRHDTFSLIRLVNQCGATAAAIFDEWAEGD
ncbi:hypothetical protein [Streptomyces sp. 2R]|uniref:hypothetical protein n=1 Tax=Streptomyces sp. 2R TaxID=1883452 RepID=UPI00118012CF|nr:hypothetical protein [Streptomyces sp. 2R]